MMNHFVLLHDMPLKAESLVMNAFALKRFQNWSITKIVKNSPSSYDDKPLFSPHAALPLKMSARQTISVCWK